MEPMSMDPAARAGGTADCNRPDLGARLLAGEELEGSLGEELQRHSQNCARCSLHLSLVRQAEGWLADRGSSNRPPQRSASPCPSAEELFDFGHGPGAVEQPLLLSRRIEAHLVECAECRGLVATLATRPPAPLLDRSNAANPVATLRPRARPETDARHRGARRPWLAYAAAAALLAGAVYVWKTRGSALGAEGPLVATLTPDALVSFPKLPVLRGTTAQALLYPSGSVLAAAANSAESAARGTWRALQFEIVPRAAATGYRVRVMREPQGAFDKAQELAQFSTTQAEFELPADVRPALLPGRYNWTAWAVVNGGLEQLLGTRSFEVVADPEALEALDAGAKLAEPARSSAMLACLVGRNYLSDARGWARSLPQSAARDRFLAEFPGR